MDAFRKYLTPALAALVTAAIMYALQPGACNGTAQSPVTPSTTQPIVVRDSIDIDSLKAMLVAELRPVYRTIRQTIRDTSVITDSAAIAEQRRIDSLALAEAHSVIGALNDRLDNTQYIQDIIAMHDTTLVDSSKESVYWLHQSYAYRAEQFGLQLKHEFLAREPTFWRYVQSLGPWVAGAVAVIKIVFDSFKP